MYQRATVVAVAILAMLSFGRVAAQDAPAAAATPAPAAAPLPAATPRPLTPVTPASSKVRRVKVYAEDWKFSPREIHVPVGTRVHLDFETHDSSHSFEIKELGIKIPLPQDKPVSYEFVADKKGEYKWFCGRPCGDGCPKMMGKLFVE